MPMYLILMLAAEEIRLSPLHFLCCLQFCLVMLSLSLSLCLPLSLSLFLSLSFSMSLHLPLSLSLPFLLYLCFSVIFIFVRPTGKHIYPTASCLYKLHVSIFLLRLLPTDTPPH